MRRCCLGRYRALLASQGKLECTVAAVVTPPTEAYVWPLRHSTRALEKPEKWTKKSSLSSWECRVRRSNLAADLCCVTDEESFFYSLLFDIMFCPFLCHFVLIIAMWPIALIDWLLSFLLQKYSPLVDSTIFKNKKTTTTKQCVKIHGRGGSKAFQISGLAPSQKYFWHWKCDPLDPADPFFVKFDPMRTLPFGEKNWQKSWKVSFQQILKKSPIYLRQTTKSDNLLHNCCL